MALCLVVLGTRAWIQYLLHEARADSAYTHAQIGQTEASIVAKLGAPDEVLPCGEYLWWNENQANPPQNKGQCKKWVRYNFFVHAFAFGYSSDGMLVSRFEYGSE